MMCYVSMSAGLSAQIIIVEEYDVLFFNECWVKCPDDFDVEGYEKKHVYREKCNGLVFFRQWFSHYIEIVLQIV